MAEAAPSTETRHRLRVISITRVLPVPGNETQGIFIANRIRAMKRHMHVTVLQPVPYCPVVRPRQPWMKEQDAEGARLPMFYLPGVMKSLDAWFLERAVRDAVGHRLEEARVDLLEAHFGYPDGTAVTRLARRFGLPAVMTLRGVENELLNTRSIGQQMRGAMRDADGCICVSHFLANLAISAGVDERRVRVIHNGIDRDVFRPFSGTDRAADFDLPRGRPIVASVGHLIERKGHHVLIRAFHRLREAVPDAYLVIAGARADQRYASGLESLVAELGLTDHVRLLGALSPEQVAGLMQAAHVFALMTSREGCCNAVLESLACGTPVVTTRVGDNAFFVRDGHNGYLTDRTPTSCAEGLRAALTGDLRDRRQISRALTVGSWDDVAIAVSDYFQQLVLGTAT